MITSTRRRAVYVFLLVCSGFAAVVGGRQALSDIGKWLDIQSAWFKLAALCATQHQYYSARAEVYALAVHVPLETALTTVIRQVRTGLLVYPPEEP